MPQYFYRCPECDVETTRTCTIAERHSQTCFVCETPLEKLIVPDTAYKPFHNYFDEGLGAEITGRNQRRLLMRELKMDFRDHMSPGDRSARIDKAREAKRERSR